MTGGDGAGLVEDDRVDLPGRLEHLRALDEDPELRAASGPDEKRGGGGEAEGAGAGDDQHGDAAVNAVAGVSPVPSQNPRVPSARAMTTGTNTAEI